MNITIIDLETTSTQMSWGRDPSPYNPANYLVSIGWWSSWEPDDIPYYNLGNETAPIDVGVKYVFQEVLDRTELLVAHNLKFDLGWLYELGYIYDTNLFCTMVGSYLLLRGRHGALDLSSCCVRYGVEPKDDEEVKALFNSGIGFEEMPWDIVVRYGKQDIASCRDLFHAIYPLLCGRYSTNR